MFVSGARDATAGGEDVRRIHTLPAWREAPFLDDRERAAMALTEAVTLIHADRVPDHVYADAAAVFDDAQVAALIWVITVINAYNRVAVATRMSPAPLGP